MVSILTSRVCMMVSMVSYITLLRTEQGIVTLVSACSVSILSNSGTNSYTLEVGTVSVASYASTSPWLVTTMLKVLNSPSLLTVNSGRLSTTTGLGTLVL